MLLRAARREAGRRGPRVQITGPELEDLAYQAAGDALLAITQKAGKLRAALVANGYLHDEESRRS